MLRMLQLKALTFLNHVGTCSSIMVSLTQYSNDCYYSSLSLSLSSEGWSEDFHPDLQGGGASHPVGWRVCTERPQTPQHCGERLTAYG